MQLRRTLYSVGDPDGKTVGGRFEIAHCNVDILCAILGETQANEGRWQ
jgi:hypothetical protein